MDAIARRKRTRTTDLPKYHNDFLLAVDAEPGNMITLPGKSPQKIKDVDLGVDFNMKWVVLITVEGDTVPQEFSPRSYIPVN